MQSARLQNLLAQRAAVRARTGQALPGGAAAEVARRLYGSTRLAGPYAYSGPPATPPIPPMPPEITNGTAASVFAAIQAAILRGDALDMIGAMATVFNAKRRAELTDAGLLRRFDAAVAAGRIRIPLWSGWTRPHQAVGVLLPSSAPPRALTLDGYVEIGGVSPFLLGFAPSVRPLLEQALASGHAYHPDSGRNGFFFAAGFEGDPLPAIITVPFNPHYYAPASLPPPQPGFIGLGARSRSRSV